MAGQDLPPAAAIDPQAAEQPYGLLMVRAVEMDKPGVLWCSMMIDHPEGREPAAELLMIAADEGGWVVKPRCARHPAADSVAILRHVDPLRACLVIKVTHVAAPGHDAAAVQALTASGICCGSCGSREFLLQLGGRDSGAIVCGRCSAVLDPPAPQQCPGCGADMELAPVLSHRSGCPERP